MDHYDLKIIDAADYAFEISIGERYGAIIEKLEQLEEGLAMKALELFLCVQEARLKLVRQE